MFERTDSVFTYHAKAEFNNYFIINAEVFREFGSQGKLIQTLKMM